MGTSAKNSGPGQSTPLIPSWLEQECGGEGGTGKPEEPAKPPETESPPPKKTDGENPDTKNDSGQTDQPLPPQQPLPPIGDPTRFRSAKINFNKAVRSGIGSGGKELHRAVSDYVRKGYGGGKGLSQRVANSTRAAGNIIGFAQTIRDKGFAEAVKEFGFQSLIGKPIEEAAGSLIDAFTGPGITTDDNIAREAWCETVKELIKSGTTDFASLTPEQWAQAVEIFLCEAISLRIINEIGNDGVGIAPDVNKIDEIERDLVSLIRGQVQDKIVPLMQDGENRSIAELNQYVNGIVDIAADFLQALGGEEDED